MRILGVNYHNVTFQEALRRALELLQRDQPGRIFFLNLDCLYKSSRDAEYRDMLNRAELVLPDGIGLKIATRLFGGKMREDCNGTDLSPVLIEKLVEQGRAIYLLGAEEGVAAAAAEQLCRTVPGIRIAGTHSGYFSDETALIEEINRSGADVLFVALGVPLQEKWIARNQNRLKVKLCLGVGALLDYLSGRKVRAPGLFRALHLEWLWRVFYEPQRLFRRYILEDLPFMAYLSFVALRQRLGMKNVIAFWVIGSLLIGGSAAFAQKAGVHWEFAGWYGGGCYPNVEFDPNIRDRLYLTSDVAGIWRSDNGGRQWSFITNGLSNLNVAQVAIAPSESNVIYAATVQGVFYSLDAGKHWQKADDADKALSFQRTKSYRPIAVSPTRPEHLCAGTTKGRIFCSRNYGERWEEVKVDFEQSGAPPVSDVEKKKVDWGAVSDFDPEKIDQPLTPVSALSFLSGHELLIANSAGIFRYDLETQAGVQLLDGKYDVSDFAFSRKKDGWLVLTGEKEIMVSRDGGVSWIRSSRIPQGKTYRVLLDESVYPPVITVAWVEDWTGGIVRSFDGGLSWQAVETRFHPDRHANPTRAWAAVKSKPASLKADPFDSKRLFLTDWWGVWRSTNFGTTWLEMVRGAPNTVGADLTITEKDEIWVATMDNGLLKSKDGGKNYQPVFPTKGYSRELNGQIWRVLVNGSRVIAASSPWGRNINQVLVSDDSGKKFTVVREGLPSKRPKGNTMWGEGYPRALAMDPRNPDLVYLGMDGEDTGGLYVSSDGGRSWRPSEGQPGSLRIYNGLVVDPREPDTLFWGACGKDGGVYRSLDGGKNWEKVFSKSSWIFDLHISGDGTLYAAGAAGHPVLYASRDKGVTWEEIGKFSKSRASAAEAIVTAPGRPHWIAVSTVSWNQSAPQQIYFSFDAGKTWHDITGDLPAGAGAAAMAFNRRGDTLYLNRYAGSVYKLELRRLH